MRLVPSSSRIERVAFESRPLIFADSIR